METSRPDGKRSVHVLFDPADWEEVRELADEDGLKIGPYIRRLVKRDTNAKRKRRTEAALKAGVLRQQERTGLTHGGDA